MIKKILTLLTLVLVAFAVQAEQTDTKPLVREGVSWVYFHNYMMYTPPTHPIVSNLYRYTFVGDTVIDIGKESVTYHKLYRELISSTVETDDYDSTAPYALVTERDGAVYVLALDGNLYADADNPLGTLIYDFGGEKAKVRTFRGNGYVEMNQVATMAIADASCRVFALSETIDAGMVIESIGFIGVNGDLLMPNPEGKILLNMSMRGFCCLEDADGNVLFKGPYYGIYNPIDYHPDLNGDTKVDISDVNIVIDSALDADKATPIADVNHDGRIDIADINAVINAVLKR